MPTEVIVAMVAAFGTVTAGMVGAISAFKANGHSREARDISSEARDIIRGNGMGDVAHMLESVLITLETHSLRHQADDIAFKELKDAVQKSLHSHATNQS